MKKFIQDLSEDLKQHCGAGKLELGVLAIGFITLIFMILILTLSSFNLIQL